MTNDLTLVIGNKAYSSWSLRPWLALMQAGATFQEILIPLDQPDTATAIRHHSPTGRVPLLRHGAITVWESLAICEYVAELFPAAGLWPEDAAPRALARALACEMHAGFAALRHDMPMNLKHRFPGQGRTPATLADIARITTCWLEARARFGGDGPFLFGRFSIADAMFAPVCTRFMTYAVDLPAAAQAYVDAILALPALQAWMRAADAEPWDLGDHR
ncbi:MAG: glutathione S-transferase family protein [Azospirillaceae bacterium]|nr:glutathione S-transferase family protein [Azospirillaceae bacterium]